MNGPSLLSTEVQMSSADALSVVAVNKGYLLDKAALAQEGDQMSS